MLSMLSESPNVSIESTIPMPMDEGLVTLGGTTPNATQSTYNPVTFPDPLLSQIPSDWEWFTADEFSPESGVNRWSQGNGNGEGNGTDNANEVTSPIQVTTNDQKQINATNCDGKTGRSDVDTVPLHLLPFFQQSFPSVPQGVKLPIPPAPFAYSACVVCYRRKVSCIRIAAMGPSGFPSCVRCVNSGVECQERDPDEVAAAKLRRSRKRRAQNNSEIEQILQQQDMPPQTKQKFAQSEGSLLPSDPSTVPLDSCKSESAENHSPNSHDASTAFTPHPNQSSLSPRSGIVSSGSANSESHTPNDVSTNADAGVSKYSSFYLASLQRHRVIQSWRANDRQIGLMLLAHKKGVTLNRATRIVLAQLLAQQTHVMAMLADQLTTADYQAFVQPIRAEQIEMQKESQQKNSLIGQLPQWVDESTRPFFVHYLQECDPTVSNPQSSASTNPSNQIKSSVPTLDVDATNESELSEYRSEMLISSAKDLLDWAAIRSDAQLDANARGSASLAAFKFLSDPALTAMLRSIDCYRLAESEISKEGAIMMQELSGSQEALGMEIATENALDTSHPTNAKSFPAPTLQISPRLHDFHASWCSRRSADLQQAPQPNGPCTCSSATPLLIRVRTNAAFGCLFGWNRSDVVSGLSREGCRWLRRLYAEDEWAEMVESAVSRMAEGARAINGFLRGLRAGAARQSASQTVKREMVANLLPNSNIPSMRNFTEPNATGVSVANSAIPAPQPPRCTYSRYSLASNRWGAVIPCTVAKWVFAQPLRFQYLMQWNVRQDVDE